MPTLDASPRPAHRARPWTRTLRSLLLLGTRLWVSWQFLKSGWLKLTTWDTTLELFRSEYQVPLLSPGLAAVARHVRRIVLSGTAGARAVHPRRRPRIVQRSTCMAVVSYWHVLGSEGFEAALAQHVLWGFMLAVVAMFGGGALSLDGLLRAPASSRETPVRADATHIRYD